MQVVLYCSQLLQEKWCFLFWKEDIYIIKLFWKFTKKGINLEINIFDSLDIATVLNTDFKLTIKMMTAYS